MSEYINELIKLIQEVLTNPIWRGSSPSVVQDIDLRMRTTIEKIQQEHEMYRDTIREQQDQISRLVRSLHEERFGFD